MDFKEKIPEFNDTYLVFEVKRPQMRVAFFFMTPGIVEARLFQFQLPNGVHFEGVLHFHKRTDEEEWKLNPYKGFLRRPVSLMKMHPRTWKLFAEGQWRHSELPAMLEEAEQRFYKNRQERLQERNARHIRIRMDSAVHGCLSASLLQAGFGLESVLSEGEDGEKEATGEYILTSYDESGRVARKLARFQEEEGVSATVLAANWLYGDRAVSEFIGKVEGLVEGLRGQPFTPEGLAALICEKGEENDLGGD